MIGCQKKRQKNNRQSKENQAVKKANKKYAV